MSVNTAAQQVIFTNDAANKIAELIAEEDNPNLKFRVAIRGGGCSGFQYDLTFVESVNDDDFEITNTADSGATVSLLVDAMSMPYLLGATVDYQNDLQGERFIIRNPKAKTTCGCGSSFDVEE